jgi:hypothetical protein
MSDAVSDQPAISLDLSLTGSSRADPAPEAFQVRPLPRQSRQQILTLSKLNLEFSFPRPRSLSEHVQNQAAAIDYLGVEFLFEKLLLCWRKLVVEYHNVNRPLTDRFFEFDEFAFSDVGAGGPPLSLNYPVNNFRVRGARKISQLSHRIIQAPARIAPALFNTHQACALCGGVC